MPRRGGAKRATGASRTPPTPQKRGSVRLFLVATGVAGLAVAAALLGRGGSLEPPRPSDAMERDAASAARAEADARASSARAFASTTAEAEIALNLTAGDGTAHVTTNAPGAPGSPGAPNGARPGCENKNADCEAWARVGECENNPGFMVRNCAPACGTCDTLLEPVCDADGPNAVGEGDIGETFRRAAALSQYGPRVLSMDPWVLVFDAFLTPEEAAEVRRIGGHDFQRSLAGDGVTAVRTSSTSWCNVPVCEREPLIKEVKRRALEVLRMPEGNSEHLQTLRYEPGQFYKVHHDQNADPKSVWGPRVYTFFFYLSDVEEGGGTRFPNLNITVEPRIGRALIWPSVYDHNVLLADMRTEHEAMPVIRGEKYASNLWLHMREFQKPLLMGCENKPVASWREGGDPEA
ncbi:hypothetical protein KFE25_002189 [Diacronema lutheri]|uniref:Procollagen-proline 4-dioxygenase n=1 Tax=Diacronema lutheri TaxID=2081491 RepID=A0A8J6CG80_DIALT|nr:hypothetical protein KFE25_002189 [Diacronema lutheri]